MKFKPIVSLKFSRIRNRLHANLTRKLDIKQESKQRQFIAEGCENYITKLEEEYDAKNYVPKFWPKRTRESFLYNGSFHEAVGRVLLVAQCFAMMPVRGITAPHPRDLSFAWSNFRAWYSLLFICTSLIDLGLTAYKVIGDQAITFNSIGPMMFRCCILLACAAAFNLARKWAMLMLHWHEIESDLPQYQSQMEKWQMAHRINMVMFVGIMLSLAEHLLNIISVVNYSIYCHKTDDPIKNFFLIACDEIFNVFSYSDILGLLGKIQNIYSTFIWNYMDIFVMIISIGLAAKFKQLNDNLFKFKGMHMPESFWAERRIQYRNLCMLCDKMDTAISLITMVSFSNNLYFICVQLLRSLNKMPSVAHAVYFYYSLIFLIGRTLAVSLYSASVNDESRKPLRYLRCVPKESWCPEVKRFTEEISSDLVALSGMKFFHLTRKLVLSVAGTIVTYELVLIQFHEDTDLWDCTQAYFA